MTLTTTLLLVIMLLKFLLFRQSEFLSFYRRYVFFPFQQFRVFLLENIPFSIGDFIYLMLGAILLFRITKLIKAFFKLKTEPKLWIKKTHVLFNFMLIIYLIFQLLWGVNYRGSVIVDNNEIKIYTNYDERKIELLKFNYHLVNKLNKEVELSELLFPSWRITNEIAKREIQSFYADISIPISKAKNTSIGKLLNYLGVQGYYNPISGEAHINKTIPAFMHPFVIVHEMSHQIGIAAEDEANLLAYIIGTQSDVAIFRYSAYFNLLLYAMAELKDISPDRAAEVMKKLNKKSAAHLEELREMRRKYRSHLRGFSIEFYDGYLKWQGQNKGIYSYRQVVYLVQEWEWGNRHRYNFHLNYNSK